MTFVKNYDYQSLRADFGGFESNKKGLDNRANQYLSQHSRDCEVKT